MVTPFDDDKLCGARSALTRIVPDEMGRFEFELMCQYTRSALNSIQSGDLVGVENYRRDSEKANRSYSVLALTQSLPVHYAAQSEGAYPGHVFLSMRSIKEDWETQENKPQYATTTILCKGVPTGWQFSYDSSKKSLPRLEEDENLPMVGAEMRPLSEEMVDQIINKGISEEESPFVHKKFEEVNVLLDKRALLTTHFGVFGFTNTGKSNLISSLVYSLAYEATASKLTKKKGTNFLIIDPNDEYLGLFIDVLGKVPESVIYIHVGFDSLSGTITRQLRADKTRLGDSELSLFYRQMKLPAELKRDNELEGPIKEALKEASKRTRIVLPDVDIGSWVLSEIRLQTDTRTGPAAKEVLRDVADLWKQHLGDDVPITVSSVSRAIDLYDAFPAVVLAPLSSADKAARDTASSVLGRVRRSLERLRLNLRDVPGEAVIPITNLVATLNDEKGAIVIVTGRRDSDLKRFASILGNQIYECRRKEGLDSPFTMMLLDEADLFLPTDSKDETTETMKEMCVTFARRGRKFGLGIGIATQRASLLDTQVMANLHTYFVSKLPRKYDRDKVAEAFGIGEEQLSPTFTFKPGNWLIISHDATGLRGVPIPVKSFNANVRIRDGLVGVKATQ